MTILKADRKALDEFLQDQTTTLLLLSGPLGSAAEQIHNDTEPRIQGTWRRVVLVTQRNVLAGNELVWLPADGTYVVLGGGVPKQVAKDLLNAPLQALPVANLMVAGNGPNPLQVEMAYAAGDAVLGRI